MWRTIQALPQLGRQRRKVFEQLFEIGNASLLMACILSLFIGGVLALVATRQSLSVAGMVGFISLGGIAARNGIRLVTHYFHLMKHEGEGFTQQMILPPLP